MKISFTHSLVPSEITENNFTKLRSYTEHLRTIVEEGGYGALESSINLPSDKGMLEKARELAQNFQDGIKYLVVVGIGGSNLGFKAIYEATKEALPNTAPEVVFLETVEERTLKSLEEKIQKMESIQEILVCVISKSGKTTETVANADMLLDVLKKQFPDEEVTSQFVVISDDGSALSNVAENNSIARLTIPSIVGGRYSIFSNVGFFPLLILGFDVEELLRGAETMRDKCLKEEENPAVLSALSLAHYYSRGYIIHDTFCFDPSLEFLGAWYRQLLAESVGKKENIHGEEVRAGITPTISIGSRDLHSVGQLSLAGPRNKTTTFILKEQNEHPLFLVPENGLFSSPVPEVSGASAPKILNALAQGAKEAYAEEGLPFIEVLFEDRAHLLFELGEFLQWKMLEIMFLAHILDVNAFDQRAVESYKKATRAILNKK